VTHQLRQPHLLSNCPPPVDVSTLPVFCDLVDGVIIFEVQFDKMNPIPILLLRKESERGRYVLAKVLAGCRIDVRLQSEVRAYRRCQRW